MELLTGEKAPQFLLRAYDKSQVSLDQFQGKKVVLLFFPLAFSRVCTAELCALRDGWEDYENLDATVIAISVDSVYTLQKYRELEGYPFLLLSDFNKEASRAYNALHEEFGLGMRGVSKRAVFVIDKEGIIRHQEILDNPGLMPDFEKVKETLNHLN